MYEMSCSIALQREKDFEEARDSFVYFPESCEASYWWINCFVLFVFVFGLDWFFVGFFFFSCFFLIVYIIIIFPWF